MGEFLSWEEVCDVADDYYAEHGEEILAKKRASWRRAPASEKQKALLSKNGLWQSGMTKGKAAQAITHHFARRAIR